MKTSRHKTVNYIEGFVKQLEGNEAHAIAKRASLDRFGQQGRKINMYVVPYIYAHASTITSIIKTLQSRCTRSNF